MWPGWVGLCLALLAGMPAKATPFSAAGPDCFFTTVASRLLFSEMGLSLGQIQVYPTNQYTPAVHRLLQVTANIYDVTSTNYFPAVYRPVFSVDASNDVWLAGYTNVPCITDPSQLAPPIDAVALAFTPNLPAFVLTNIYNVPWIIAARKGFPNFNEYVEENIVGMTRRLQFTRNINGATMYQVLPITGTNQMYLMSLHNSGGLDFWNPYTNNFTDNVTVSYRVFSLNYITNSDTSDVVPTLPYSPLGFFTSNSISLEGWPGTGLWAGGQPNANSFYVPVNFTGFTSLSNSVYRTPYAGGTPGALPLGFPAPCLVPTNYFGTLGMTTIFETNLPAEQQFYVPQWGLVTTNQLQVYILDQDARGTSHVIDYVNLEMAGSQNINNEIFNDDTNGEGSSQSPQGIWNMNLNAKYPALPWGIYNQIQISRGFENVSAEDGTWQGDPEAATYSSSVGVQIADFDAFFYPWGSVVPIEFDGGIYYGSNYEASVQAPYAPTRYAVGYTVLEANDPLVHYMTSDLVPSFPVDLQTEYNNFITNVPGPSAVPFTLGKLNYNFRPWGGNPYLLADDGIEEVESLDPLLFSLEERDPGTFGPDNWGFPTNQVLSIDWLGQVHRGTPWQTIYLKSPDITRESYQLGGGQQRTSGLNIWAQWTGDTNLVGGTNYTDAYMMAPVQDWKIAGILAAMFNTNSFSSLISVNDPNTNDWMDALDGLTAVTNSTPAEFLEISSDSPQASAIANAIQAQRMSEYAGSFASLGDILATPELSVQSPFLNLSSSNNITDEEYEAIPGQLLSLLRVDSIGSVTSTANGQVVFQFTGYDNEPYLIESSPDLVNWSIVSTNSPVNGTITVTNTPSANAGMLFYRTVSSD
jgi:hypothetical protein